MQPPYECAKISDEDDVLFVDNAAAVVEDPPSGSVLLCGHIDLTLKEFCLEYGAVKMVAGAAQWDDFA